MGQEPLNLALHPPKRSHPPTEPQPHLNPPEQGIRFRTEVEWIMVGVAVVVLLVAALFGVAR